MGMDNKEYIEELKREVELADAEKSEEAKNGESADKDCKQA